MLSGWARRPRSTGPDEVHELLTLLAAVIHESWLDPVAKIRKVDQRLNSALGRRLLELLRDNVLGGRRESGVPDAELLPLLMAGC